MRWASCGMGYVKAIAIAELLLPSIGQQTHRGWDLRADGAHLPEAGGCFPRRGRVLAGQLIHTAHGSIQVREAQVFDDLHHLRTHAMMLALVPASTWCQPDQSVTPEARVVVPQGTQADPDHLRALRQNGIGDVCLLGQLPKQGAAAEESVTLCFCKRA